MEIDCTAAADAASFACVCEKKKRKEEKEQLERSPQGLSTRLTPISCFPFPFLQPKSAFRVVSLAKEKLKSRRRRKKRKIEEDLANLGKRNFASENLISSPFFLSLFRLQMRQFQGGRKKKKKKKEENRSDLPFYSHFHFLSVPGHPSPSFPFSLLFLHWNAFSARTEKEKKTDGRITVVPFSFSSLRFYPYNFSFLFVPGKLVSTWKFWPIGTLLLSSSYLHLFRLSCLVLRGC